jgi:hypothetical protein
MGNVHSICAPTRYEAFQLLCLAGIHVNPETRVIDLALLYFAAPTLHQFCSNAAKSYEIHTSNNVTVTLRPAVYYDIRIESIRVDERPSLLDPAG